MYERFYNLRERPFDLTPNRVWREPSNENTVGLVFEVMGAESHASTVGEG